MMNKLKTFWKNFDEKIIKGGVDYTVRNETHSFKGQRINKKVVGTGGPIPTREQYEQEYKLEPEIRMQSRELRFKHIGYGLLYFSWFTGAILFIMYRLGGDDLEKLEKEAEERIKLQKSLRALRQESKGGDETKTKRRNDMDD